MTTVKSLLRPSEWIAQGKQIDDVAGFCLRPPDMMAVGAQKRLVFASLDALVDHYSKDKGILACALNPSATDDEENDEDDCTRVPRDAGGSMEGSEESTKPERRALFTSAPVTLDPGVVHSNVQATVFHQFIADRPGELSVSEGHIVNVIERVDKSWIKVSLHSANSQGIPEEREGGTGLVPESYLGPATTTVPRLCAYTGNVKRKGCRCKITDVYSTYCKKYHECTVEGCYGQKASSEEHCQEHAAEKLAALGEELGVRFLPPAMTVLLNPKRSLPPRTPTLAQE